MSSNHMTASLPIRILVVDDHPAVREGLALLLAPEGIEVCAEAGGRADALARVEESRPGLVIVDLSLDGEDGLALIADLHDCGVPVLVYSMHNDARRVAGAFVAGALGYVTKRELHGILVEAIRKVAVGQRFVSPQAAAALVRNAGVPPVDDAVCKLSRQEREVYQLLSRGADTQEIGAALEICPHTVESYYARILVKLRLKGIHELRCHAIAHFQKHSR